MSRTIRILPLLLLFAVPGLRAQQQGTLIDGTVATVGMRNIYLSDIEKDRVRRQLQGEQTDRTTQCAILEDLLMHELLIDQAELDSIMVNDSEVKGEVEQRVRYMILQAGDEATLEKQFGRSMKSIRTELTEMLVSQRRAQRVRSQVIGKVRVNPKEVQDFYHSMPEDSIPLVPENYTYRQFCLNPAAGVEAEYEVKARLLELRERILKGERFSTLAVVYSEDKASAIKGGEMGMLPRESFVKAFADVAFSLKEGQVSPIVKTEYGFHIIQMIERKGDMANVRHILLKPTYTGEMLAKSQARIDSIRRLIASDSLTFEQACYRWSEDKDTRLNGGLVSNPAKGGSLLDRETIIPVDYYVLKDLKEGQLSQPFESRDLRGNVVIKMIRLDRLVPPHRLDITRDYPVLQDMAKAKKEQEVFEQWMQQKQQGLYLRVATMFEGCAFRHPYWTDRTAK